MSEKVIKNVYIMHVFPGDEKYVVTNTVCNLYLKLDPEGLIIILKSDKDKFDLSINYNPQSEIEILETGKQSQLIKLENNSVIFLTINNENEMKKFQQVVQNIKDRRANSVFSLRTEESSASQYFQFYGYLSQQQNMMQDFVRTSTYQRAIHSNLSDFADKVVLDVGAGSGILSFFAVQAGARKVYAVEASNMAQYAQQLVDANSLTEKIKVVSGKIEEIELPEKVDIIISEPMGYMLYNERMLETYLHAKKFLKKGGKMFPSRGDLHVAPFTDEALYMEQFNKSNFWYQTSFHGVDLSYMRVAAMREYFRQPIVDTFDIRICMSKSIRHVVNFLEADEKDLHRIDIPLEFHVLETGTCHGLAFWFDVEFGGSTNHVWLSTSPTEPLTHWYQVRCLLQNPFCVKQGQLLTGHVLLEANKRQSYDVTIELRIEGTDITSNNTLDLKNPYFRYTGVQVTAPPGSSTTSPSEIYWNHLDAQGAKNAVNLVNGISVNGLGEVQLDSQHFNSNFVNMGHPSIHPGCISSTGRSRVNSGSNSNNNSAVQPQNLVLSNNLGLSSSGNILSSTQNAAQQLIGGAIAPSMFGNSAVLTAGVQPQPNHTNQHPQVSLLTDLLTNSAQYRSCASTNFFINSENTTIVDAPMLSAMEQMFSVIQQP